MAIDKTKAINPMDLIPQEPQEPEQPTLSPTEFDYIEETENGVAIGRSLNGAKKRILMAGAKVAAIQPHVVAQRKARG